MYDYKPYIRLYGDIAIVRTLCVMCLSVGVGSKTGGQVSEKTHSGDRPDDRCLTPLASTLTKTFIKTKNDGYYTVSFSTPEGTRVTKARYVFVYKRSGNGKWEIIDHHSSAMPVAPAGLKPATTCAPPK